MEQSDVLDQGEIKKKKRTKRGPCEREECPRTTLDQSDVWMCERVRAVQCCGSSTQASTALNRIPLSHRIVSCVSCIVYRVRGECRLVRLQLQCVPSWELTRSREAGAAAVAVIPQLLKLLWVQLQRSGGVFCPALWVG